MLVVTDTVPLVAVVVTGAWGNLLEQYDCAAGTPDTREAATPNAPVQVAAETIVESDENNELQSSAFLKDGIGVLRILSLLSTSKFQQEMTL